MIHAPNEIEFMDIDLCHCIHLAYHNEAIVLYDRTTLHGHTKEAKELWKHAANNYEIAALNYGGLALLYGFAKVWRRSCLMNDYLLKGKT
ncbi:unnamed protein product [Lactuca virosa]|uniref:Uncharacterized protein n=1 Tax=Lactuca virosa TaxID=75947 RepID=A0AAU9PGY4_9ASTR|nr:unnamed protein product [Lactuca virosa]